MIAKCKAISHGGAMLDYAMKKQKMEQIIGRNLLSETTPTGILEELEMVNGYNSRCRNKYLRFEIGIAPDDRGKLQFGDLKNIAFLFAKKMGIENNQWIAVTHKDTRNLHIHLIANRIGIDGAVYDTTFVSNRSARTAEEISREMGLTIAKEVRPQKEYVKRGQSRDRLVAREELQKIAFEALRSTQTIQEFLHLLGRKGVAVEPARNKQNKIYGLRFSYRGEVFKASEIGREFGYHTLLNHFGLTPAGQSGKAFVPKYALAGTYMADLIVDTPNYSTVHSTKAHAAHTFSILQSPAEEPVETLSDAERRRRKQLKRAKGRGL